MSMDQAMAEVRANGCDAENPSMYYNGQGKYVCRCIVCARCDHHTGNSTQGHFWKFCRVQAKFHENHKRSILFCDKCEPEYHLCCPGNCEIYHEDGSRK